MENEHGIWLVYDGECPLCNASAHALKIRKAVGELHLINARENHPIMTEINKAGFDLDQGMVVKFEGHLYHGADAQHVLAMLGTNSDWVNRINVLLFRYKWSTKLLYPIFRSTRNVLLKIRGATKINNLNKR